MKLNEICEVYSGYALKAFNDAEDGLPVVKIGNILTDGTLNLEECQYTTDSVNEKYYSQRGDIYIALSGATTGKIGIMDTREKYVINQRVGIVRQKSDDVPQEYIKYFLLRQTDRILQEAAGCAQPNISPKQIAEYVIPDTSQEKMQEICEVLDRIKKIIDSRKAEISALDNLIKARFVEMFGDPIINSKGWPEALIGDDCFVTKLAGFEYTQYINYDNSGDVVMVKAQNVKNGKLNRKELSFISSEVSDSLPRSQLAPGDIVMTYVGANIGDVAVIDDKYKYHLAPNVAKIRPDSEIYDSTYFMYMLMLLNTYIVKNSADTAKAALGMERIRKLKVFTPPIETQRQFADFVHQVDKSKFIQ